MLMKWLGGLAAFMQVLVGHQQQLDIIVMGLMQ